MKKLCFERDTYTPFISVVIPTYNSEKYIAETLRSVFHQTYENYEVIVSDDGSKDKTREIVKVIFSKFPGTKTKLLCNTHEGPGATRNRGIIEAGGEWIAFLDSDDLWFLEKLKKVAEFISNSKQIDLVCNSEIQKYGNNTKLLRYSELFSNKKELFLSLYRKNTLSTSAVSVKRSLLLKAGLFDVTLPAAQDYELWLRLATIPNVKIGFIEDPLGYYIIRDGSISSASEQRLRCLLKINQKHFEHLKQVSKFPLLEGLAYEGRHYVSTGLELICKGDLKKGIVFFVVGIVKWPFRFDWVSKVIKIFH